MLNTFFRILIALLVCLYGLAACTSTAPRTSQDDLNVRTVAVIGLLDSRIPVYRRGVTVFGNTSTEFESPVQFNELVENLIRDKLKVTRPKWTLISKIDRSELDQAIRAAGGPGSFSDEQAKALMAKVARSLKADLIFYVNAASMETVPVNGFGILVVSRMLEPTRIAPQVNVRLVIADTTGKPLNQRLLWGEGRSELDKTGIGISEDLGNTSNPEIQQRIVAVLSEILSSRISSAMVQLGY